MGLFDIIRLLGFGFFVGLIARFLLPGDQKMGLVMTTLLGIAGAVTGYFGARFLGLASTGTGFIASTVCAMLLLFVGHKWNSRVETR